MQVEKLADSNPMFAQFLRDPSVPKKEKVTALEEILGKIQVSKTTQSFFGKGSHPCCPTVIPFFLPFSAFLRYFVPDLVQRSWLRTTG